MRTIRICLSSLALAVVFASLATAPTSAARHVRDPRATTQGVIVWSQQTADGTSQNLMIARGDGSHVRELTPAIPDGFDIDAQVSPNGQWIAYEHEAPTGDTVRLVRPNGARDHLLDVGCVDPCGGVDAPTWLSGHKIAFLLAIGPLDENGNAVSAVLFTSRVNGTQVRRLSEPGIDGVFEDRYARLSRDRNYITFQRLRLADFASALFRMAPNGSDVRQLTPWELNVDLYDLSTARRGPTKDLIVFQSTGRGDPDQTFVDTGFVPATCTSLADCTSKIVWMTDNGATGRRTSNPQWSPDSSSLVFADRSSIDDPNAEVWTMRFGGTESDRSNISNSTNFDFRPAWGIRAH